MAASKSKQSIKYRNLKKIDHTKFSSDLSDAIKDIHIPGMSFNSAIDEVKNICQSLLDNHAPVIEKQITLVQNAKWFDAEYKLLRCQRRKSERKWRKSIEKGDQHQTEQLKNVYLNLRAACIELSNSKKKAFYTDLIEKSSNKPQTLFRNVNKLMDRN